MSSINYRIASKELHWGRRRLESVAAKALVPTLPQQYYMPGAEKPTRDRCKYISAQSFKICEICS